MYNKRAFNFNNFPEERCIEHFRPVFFFFSLFPIPHTQAQPSLTLLPIVATDQEPSFKAN